MLIPIPVLAGGYDKQVITNHNRRQAAAQLIINHESQIINHESQIMNHKS
ncbi:MAG: hypothetical protein RLZ33_1447 [Bacteroidota bacterium]|jgi:hypothetical protein